MTTGEKLGHSQDIRMTGARERSTRTLDNYVNALEAASEEHVADAGRRVDMQVEAETEKLGRKIDERLSIGQLGLERETNHKQEELKDELLAELCDKLANFMETQGYRWLLGRQVKTAKGFAGDEELIIHMDPSDADKLQRIAMHHNATIKVNEYSFSGGTRAMLPSKYILIDSLFQTKPDEARHEFKSGLTGGRQGG